MESSLKKLALFSGGDDTVGLNAKTARSTSDLTHQVLRHSHIGTVSHTTYGPSEDIIRDPSVPNTRGRVQTSPEGE